MAEQRLIDAHALRKNLSSRFMNELYPDWLNLPKEIKMRIEILANEFRFALDHAPTIDAAPVVHARWEPIDGTGDGIYKLWRCSACKNGTTAGGETGPDVPYCFCCGAKMDGRL